VSRPISLNMDLRSLETLRDMGKEGGRPDPSRSRSMVHLWWNFGLTCRLEGTSGSEGYFDSWAKDMLSCQ
jgi:hypothetical protein